MGTHGVDVTMGGVGNVFAPFIDIAVNWPCVRDVNILHSSPRRVSLDPGATWVEGFLVGMKQARNYGEKGENNEFTLPNI